MSVSDSEPADTLVVSSVGGQTGRRPSRAKRSPATLRQIVMNLGGSVRLNPTGVAVLCLVVILLVYFNTGGGHVPASTDPVNLKQLLSVAIAVAEAGGKGKLFTAPASQPAAHSLELVAHGSQATAVRYSGIAQPFSVVFSDCRESMTVTHPQPRRFLEDPVQLVSVGGRETSIIQWNLETLNS